MNNGRGLVLALVTLKRPERFSRFDLNGNGTIEVEELAVVFQVLAPRHVAER